MTDLRPVDISKLRVEKGGYTVRFQKLREDYERCEAGRSGTERCIAAAVWLLSTNVTKGKFALCDRHCAEWFWQGDVPL